jgi:hypothetical protein
MKHNHWTHLLECHNLNIGFTTKLVVQGPMKPKELFRCETHFQKWGRVQGMKPNDSQVHSHFGSCICRGIMNVHSFGWKDKQTPNWAKRS